MSQRFVLSSPLYALAVVVLAAGLSLSLLAGCPSVAPPDGNDNGNVNENDNTNTNGNGNGNGNGGTTQKAFAGAVTCQACHNDAHADWTATSHAEAFESLRTIGQHENAACLPCHTVGFGVTDGFVDEAASPGLLGVQCENCHGPAGDHTRNPGDASLRPTINLAATLCGECHTDAHHPTFDEWQLSDHAEALATLQANPFAQDSCLECHSQDYRWAVEKQAEDPTVELPTLQTAALSIECATCHAPHGGVAQAHQLRQPIADVCGECHTQAEAALGSTPHHPQIEMITGMGAFDAAADPLERQGPHTGLFASGGAACAQCHVVRHEVEEPNDGNPNVTGHTFNPFDEDISAISPEHQAQQYDGCLMCHGTAEQAEQRRTEVQGDIGTRLEALAGYFDAANAAYIDPATLSEEDQARLTTAKFNFQFVEADGSVGVHNSRYAEAVLEVAEEIVAELTGP